MSLAFQSLLNLPCIICPHLRAGQLHIFNSRYEESTPRDKETQLRHVILLKDESFATAFFEVERTLQHQLERVLGPCSCPGAFGHCPVCAQVPVMALYTEPELVLNIIACGDGWRKGCRLKSGGPGGGTLHTIHKYFGHPDALIEAARDKPGGTSPIDSGTPACKDGCGCNLNFSNAAPLRGSGKGKVADEGLVAIVCSHGIVGREGVVNMPEAENHLYYFAILDWWSRDPDSKIDVCMIDIGCQLGPHLTKRIEEMKADAFNRLTGDARAAELRRIAKLEDIEIYVPWFHAAGHRIRCQLEWSALFASETGRAIGETCEQIWGILYPITGSIRYYTAERRRDLISIVIAAMDAKHEVGLWESLCHKYIWSVEKVVDLTRAIEELVSLVKDKHNLDSMADATRLLDDESAKLTAAQKTGRISDNWKVDFARLTIVRHLGGLQLPHSSQLAFASKVGSNAAEVKRFLKDLTEEHTAELKALNWHSVPVADLIGNADFGLVWADVVAGELATTEDEVETRLLRLAMLENGRAAKRRKVSDDPDSSAACADERRDITRAVALLVRRRMWWSALRLGDLEASAKLSPSADDVNALMEKLVSAAKSQHIATPFPWPPFAHPTGGGFTAVTVQETPEYRHKRSDLDRSEEDLLLLITQVKRAVNFFAWLWEAITAAIADHIKLCSLCGAPGASGDAARGCGDLHILRKRLAEVGDRRREFDFEKLKTTRLIATSLSAGLDNKRIDSQRLLRLRRVAMSVAPPDVSVGGAGPSSAPVVPAPSLPAPVSPASPSPADLDVAAALVSMNS